jgi:uncharacterized protein (TIGR02996 family)
MDKEVEFLDAIRQTPSDDHVRLKFADWLEKNGDTDRAQLIRVQCELEPIRERPDLPAAALLREREKALFDRNWQKWTGRIGLVEFYGVKPPIYRRGIADSAVIQARNLIKHGAALLEDHPSIKKLTVHGLHRQCKKFVKCTALARIDHLEIADWPTAEEAAILTKSKPFENISSFRFWVGSEIENSLAHHLMTLNWKPAGTVELLQLAGGVTATSGSAMNAAVDHLAERLAKHWGIDRVAVHRPFELRFPLSGNLAWACLPATCPMGEPS